MLKRRRFQSFKLNCLSILFHSLSRNRIQHFQTVQIDTNTNTKTDSCVTEWALGVRLIIQTLKNLFGPLLLPTPSRVLAPTLDQKKKKKKPVTYCAINIYKDLIRNDQAVLYSYLISQTVSLGSSGDLDFLFQLN